MQRQKGFSLIELLIVVAIMLIIASIAIPGLMSARKNANDAAAVTNLKAINTDEVTYSNTYPNVGFATLASLGPGNSVCPGNPSAAGACLLDGNLGCANAPCVKNAFKYTITVLASGADYVAAAVPAGPGSGDKDYCAYPDSPIRFQPDNQASNPPVATDAACNAYSPI